MKVYLAVSLAYLLLVVLLQAATRMWRDGCLKLPHADCLHKLLLQALNLGVLPASQARDSCRL
jgi:hypothetical protein